MNETDRELLQFAAKAAGLDYYARSQSGGMLTYNGEWNPLADDGDALRLAVKLGIGMRHHVNWSQVFSLQTGVEDFHHDTDPYAATRRAIVRAAAEIGRTMK
jgi:hypothetical protein